MGLFSDYVAQQLGYKNFQDLSDRANGKVAPPESQESAAGEVEKAAGTMTQAADALETVAAAIEQDEEEASFFEPKYSAIPEDFEGQKALIDSFFGFTTHDENGNPLRASQFGTYTAMSRLGAKGAAALVGNGASNEITRLSMGLGNATNMEEYLAAAMQLSAYLESIGAAKPAVKVNVDTADAMAQVQALIDKINSIPPVTTGGGNDGAGNALGGRFATATRGLFGEDGTEYIIPITKPARAKALIIQMLREMGAGATDILTELGATSGGGFGGGPGMGWSSQPAAMYPQAGGNVKTNSDNNVNVPTTINVYGSGDALMAGQAAARASQSNVLRAVKGVVAV